MKRGTSRHPKLLHLCRILGLSRRDAVGLLELLWEYTCDYAPAGDIGKFDDNGIAAAVEWNGNPGELISALAEARWLDACPKHRLIVHDWAEHAPDYIKKRLSRMKTGFVVAVQTTADIGGHCPPVCCSQTQPNQTRGGEGKPAVADATPKRLAPPSPPSPRAQKVNNQAVAEAREAGATEALIAYHVAQQPEGAAPWAGPNAARDAAREVLADFRRITNHKDDNLTLEYIGEIEFDVHAPDGQSKQANLEGVRERHRATLEAAGVLAAKEPDDE